MNYRQTKVLRKSELAEQIRSDCRRGDLPPGSPLPSVRELALKHGLSKRVVNEELQKLVTAGLLRSVPRVGVFVRDTAPEGLLNHTVIVLSAGKGQPLTGQRHGGWLSHVAVGALREIEEQGLNAVFLNPERLSEDVLDRLTSEKPLGMVIPETSADLRGRVPFGSRMLANGVPVIFNTGDPSLAQFDRVASDAEQGSYQLTRWFLQQGRTGIAMIYPPSADKYWAVQRRAGYENAMREAGLSPRPGIELPPYVAGPAQEILSVDYVRSVAEVLRPFLGAPQGLSVLLAASDGPVAELEAACQYLGLYPGKDVFLAGYDNYWMDLEMCSYPAAHPVVTVDRRNETMGVEMIRLLLERVRRGPLHGSGGGPLLRSVIPRVIVADPAQAANVPATRTANPLLITTRANVSPVGVGAGL